MYNVAIKSRLEKLMLATCLSPLLASVLLGTAALAASGPTPLSEAPYTISKTADLTIGRDRTTHTAETLRIKIQSEGAIQSVGQQRFTYIEGMETVDIVEAYTEKADGRIISVDPTEILTSDAASGLAVMFMRDQKVRTVIFPDLAVGDTIVLKTIADKNRDFFPDQFADQFALPRALPIADATFTITYPKDVPVKIGVHGEEISHKIDESEFGTRHVITYQSKGILSEQPGSVSIWDREPYVMFSTFSTFEEFGRAYWTEAAPRAQVTSQIQQIADRVTDGIAERRAQAEAIDRWVKANIRYIAVYLGEGRWTPHAADDVLRNRYGDCKDHAILMAALLAAKGIESEQVLINLGNAYTLPDVASKSYFNHVILYVPELELYDDPTSTHYAFGVLHEQEYDKPVVHAGLNGARIAHTPIMQANDHTEVNLTTVTVAADGTLSGETTQTATGIFAAGLRAMAVNAQAAGLTNAAANLLKIWKLSGTAHLAINPLDDLSKQYQVKVQFTYGQKWSMPLNGPRAILFGVPLLKRPGEFLLNVRESDRRNNFQCHSGHQIEEIQFTFAEGLPLPQKLNGRVIDTRSFTYTSNYSLDGRTFTIRREFIAHVAGQVCAADLEAEIARDMKTVDGSMGTKLAFKPNTVAPISPIPPPSEKKAELTSGSATAQH